LPVFINVILLLAFQPKNTLGNVSIVFNVNFIKLVYNETSGRSKIVKVLSLNKAGDLHVLNNSYEL